ncbi:MAG: M50 family metallopeptidase [Candidatus Paceibacterota bacterium]
MTTILIFIAVLAVLVFVHELGHFSVAKWFGMRVDEFGIGFPPRAAAHKPEGSETTYSLNWLPLGGFVKIFGENGAEEDDPDHPHFGRSFGDKPWYAQIAVLVAGVAMNMLLAWVLFSLSFMFGTLAAPDADDPDRVTDVGIIVTQVLPDSPADEAGIVPGDKITDFRLADSTSTATVTADVLQQTVLQASSSAVVLELERSTEGVVATSTATVTPTVLDSGNTQIGIAMAEAGILKLGFFPALAEGYRSTVSLTEQTYTGFKNLVMDAISGGGESLKQVAGPVGIAGLVGDAADRGLAPLLSFMALISINLAILNLLPFPALDGGRIVFVLIETVTQRKIPANVAGIINGIGMLLLLLLMVLVTYQDIVRLF